MTEGPTPTSEGPQRQLTFADFQVVFQGGRLARDARLQWVREQRGYLAEYAADVRHWMAVGPGKVPVHKELGWVTYVLTGRVDDRMMPALGAAVEALWGRYGSARKTGPLNPAYIADEVGAVLAECDRLVAELDEILRVEEGSAPA